MEALAHLGIDGKLLLAQVVNFVIVLLVLKRFAYQPMLKLLDERSAKIERGLADAEAAQTKLAEIETREKTVLAEARAEAKKILMDTEVAAKKRDAAKVSETEAHVAKLLAEAEVKIQEDRAKMIEDAKRELSETVMLAVEKVLRGKMDAATDRALIEKVLS